MKKILAILALVAFLGGIGAPAIAATVTESVSVELPDKDPKKSKSDKKSGESTSEKKSSDCTSEKKAADCKTEKKSSDCCNK